MKRGLVILMLWSALLGCDTSVDPIEGTERPFTMWGLVNPEVDTQAVRLFSIENQLQLIGDVDLDATFTSRNQTTGEVRVWKDSLVTLADGDRRHVFWSAFPVHHGETFTFEAQRSDSATSTTAPVTVPPPVTVRVAEPNRGQVRPILLPVRVDGEPPTMPRIDVEYQVESVAGAGTTTTRALNVIVPYEGRAQPVNGGWEINVDLTADVEAVREAYDAFDERFALLVLNAIEARIHVGDAAWVSPIGRFDAEVLVEPGLFSNVENGFGFVGAAYVDTVRWVPPLELLQRAGYVNQQTRAPH
ncbi:MAG: hypothetical protein AAGJ10_00620 [Bacteroidota bacterium]